MGLLPPATVQYLQAIFAVSFACCKPMNKCSALGALVVFSAVALSAQGPGGGGRPSAFPPPPSPHLTRPF